MLELAENGDVGHGVAVVEIVATDDEVAVAAAVALGDGGADNYDENSFLTIRVCFI